MAEAHRESRQGSLALPSRALVLLDVLATGVSFVVSLALRFDAPLLYWTGSLDGVYGIFRSPSGGGPSTLLYATNEIAGLISDGPFLYFAESDATVHGILRLAK